jgi:hypothetical protein
MKPVVQMVGCWLALTAAIMGQTARPAFEGRLHQAIGTRR